MILEKAIGIDLGTTNSVVAMLDLSDRRLLFAKHGSNEEPILPSAVAWLPDENRFVVGRPARARRGLDPEPVLSVKRRMGRQLPVSLAGKSVTPAHVSSLILRELAEQMQAEAQRNDTGVTIRRAVITVPAHFKHPAMEDTTLAGQEAGLEVVELLHEPIAASIHFCWQRNRQRRQAGQDTGGSHEETFLIFDMGGGTLDVSVIRRIPNPASGDDFQTLAIAGDSLLGGDDFDATIAQDLFQRIAGAGYKFHSLNPGEAQNRVRCSKLLALAEEIKIRMSDADQLPIDRRNFFDDDNGAPVRVQTVYTLLELEDLMRETAERTLDYCDEALEEARLDAAGIDSILMIGGSSRVPLVRDILFQKYCTGERRAKCQRPIIHAPDICVGAGAALKAASLGRIYRREQDQPGVRMLNYGASASTHSPVLLELEEPQRQGGLQGGRALLATQSGASYPGEILSNQRALFEAVALAPEQNTFLQLQLRNGSGNELAGFDFFIRHDSTFVEPLGSNTSANVLSYELSLKVLDAGGSATCMANLAPKLTPLPKEFQYPFQYPGEAESLVFPMFGDGQLIKKIRVPIDPGTPVGAKIELTVTIDAAQVVRCHGQIPDAPGEGSFAFEVEAPEVQPIPTQDDFRRLRAQSEAVISQYRGPDIGRRALKTAKLVREIERAFEHQDDAKVIQGMEDLRVLVDDLDPAKQRVHPPIEELEEHVDQCQALIHELPRQTTLDLDEIARDVEANAAAARTATQQLPPDQETYTRSFNNLKNHHEALSTEYQRIHKPTDAETAVALIRVANARYADATRLPLDAEDRRILDEARAAIDEAEKIQAEQPRRAADLARKGLNQAKQVIARHPAEELSPPDDEDDPNGTLVQKRQ